MSKPEFACWLRQRVVSRTPTAVVRFGDGEVRLLRADAGDPGSRRIANSQLERETGRTHPPEAVLEVKAALEHAYNEADVLGIPASVQFQATRTANPLATLYLEGVAAGKPPAKLTSSMLHHEILAELPELLAGRRISVISCRNIKPIVEDRWELEDVAVYQVPSQYRTRDLDGAYEATMHDVSIWPDAHDRVLSDLTVRERGEVFLVGAGVFGKDLCIRVREQDGIALDMGSALDHIAGKLTRPSMRRVFELHAGGMSIPDIATTMEDQPGAQVDHDRIRDFINTVTLYIR